MKRYLEHMRNQEPHDRRTHALRVASVVTAVVFVGWISTLGMRLGTTDVAADEQNTDQVAAVAQTQTHSGPSLEVSTTSVFLPDYHQ